MKMICIYDGEPTDALKAIGSDYLEIYADVEVEMEECDYGVPGSPVWMEVCDFDMWRIYVDEDSYTKKEFSDKFGKDAFNEIWNWASEAVDKEDWE